MEALPTYLCHPGQSGHLGSLGESQSPVDGAGGQSDHRDRRHLGCENGTGCSISFTAPVKSVNSNYEVMENSQSP